MTTLLATQTILIIEDDQNLNRLFSRKLSRPDVACLSAFSVSEAYDLLAGGLLPDLVILDLELPDGSGNVVLEMLKARQFASTRVIVVSGHAYARDNQVARYRTDYVLLKPVSPRELGVLALHLLATERTPVVGSGRDPQVALTAALGK